MSNENIPALVEPPTTEAMPFDAFQTLMNSTRLDEYYKYYDSDGTVDLEDDYEGDSDLSGDEADDTDSSSDSAVEDDDDVDDPAATSRHNDPKLQETIFRTELLLERLSVAAQPVLEEQPMSTRIVLANQAVPLFERYGGHGSMHRFSQSVMEYLNAGERVRRPGAEGRDPKKDGILRFAPVEPAKVDGEEVQDGGLKKLRKDRGKRKAGEEEKSGRKERKVQDGDSIGIVRLKLRPSEVGQVVVVEDEKDCPARLSIPEGAHHSRISSLFNFNLDTTKRRGVVTSKNKSEEVNEYLDDEAVIIKPRNGKSKPVLPHVETTSHLAPPLQNRSILSPTSPSSAFARFTLSGPTTPILPQQKANPHATYSCTTHPTLNAQLATQPYNPISLTFKWPATSRQNSQPTMPTPGLLDALNNILHLYNAEGRFLLSYYVRKFETPPEFGGNAAQAAPGGNVMSGQPKVEPPHALFRLGIAQYLWGKVGKVIDNKEVDELGLNPEARRLFGEVWERHPSTAAWWSDSLLTNATTDVKNSTKTGDDKEEDPYAHSSDFETDISAADESDANDTPATLTNKRARRAARVGRRRKIQEVEKKKRERALGGLNPMEKVILARATNVSVETVEVYWDDMREKTKAWGAMKMWCEAQEKRMIRKAKVEGRW
ncbi:hypothetical protein H2198_009319 [Neophaeococcomyces mojaviensis]|uniref:Uncharacterized protein n=1 Tax=Neophaeococcomyces mojaviensis TaxID=3383035 RepID=A0ACC2ZV07_9EURO|nr:hypothetical protein H2198_009319 [Knufia sp. JES_112]